MVLEMEMSKTYQYRKVMKPMLERKRRARINKCLDELKDIMVECLTQEGEHITRLEKADILELTVEHMKKLRAQKQLRIQNGNGNVNGLDAAKLSVAESFRAGYVHAANEVSKTLATVPGVSVDLGTQLMSHLGHRLNYLQVVVPTAVITTQNSGSSTSSSSSGPTSITGTTIGIGGNITSALAAFTNNTSTTSIPIISSSSSPVSTTSSSSSHITTNFGGYFDHHTHHHQQQYQQQLQQQHTRQHLQQQQQQQQHQNNTNVQLMQHGQQETTSVIRIPVITPPPSECSSDRSCSPSPSESQTTNGNGQPWRPW